PPAAACSEATAPYACQNLADWAKLPHDAACPMWDGSPPAVTPGRCTVSLPTGDAAKYAGPDPGDPKTLILPDGRRDRPAGAEWVFNEPTTGAGLTTAVIAVPGTKWVLTVDSGFGNH